jgi:hypothetical protein
MKRPSMRVGDHYNLTSRNCRGFSSNHWEWKGGWTHETSIPYGPAHEQDPHLTAQLRATAPLLPGRLTGRRSFRACRPSPAGGFNSSKASHRNTRNAQSLRGREEYDRFGIPPIPQGIVRKNFGS